MREQSRPGERWTKLRVSCACFATKCGRDELSEVVIALAMGGQICPTDNRWRAHSRQESLKRGIAVCDHTLEVVGSFTATVGLLPRSSPNSPSRWLRWTDVAVAWKTSPESKKFVEHAELQRKLVDIWGDRPRPSGWLDSGRHFPPVFHPAEDRRGPGHEVRFSLMM